MKRLLLATAIMAMMVAPALAQTNGPKDTGGMALPDGATRPIQAAPPTNDTGGMAVPGHDGASTTVTGHPPANDTGSMAEQDHGAKPK